MLKQQYQSLRNEKRIFRDPHLALVDSQADKLEEDMKSIEMPKYAETSEHSESIYQLTTANSE